MGTKESKPAMRDFLKRNHIMAGQFELICGVNNSSSRSQASVEHSTQDVFIQGKRLDGRSSMAGLGGCEE